MSATTDRPSIAHVTREHGSQNHEILRNLVRAGGPADERSVPGLEHRQVFYSTGRDALIAVLSLVSSRNGQRLLCPSYFCQQVVSSLSVLGLPLVVYSDAPTEPPPMLDRLPLRPGDVVLTTGYLGIRGPATGEPPQGVVVIEDHSHDPDSEWARLSRAHYAVASLRKSMPVPDGAVAWSPRDLPLPAEPTLTAERAAAVFAMTAGMLLKTAYLEGSAVPKEVYRSLLEEAESTIAMGQISGMSALSRAVLCALDKASIRRARRQNHAAFGATLGGCRGVRVLSAKPEHTPFTVALVFDGRTRRDAVRRALIAHNIYPAVLWPLDSPVVAGIPNHHRDLAERMLAIPCDARYSTADMEWVAERVTEIVAHV